MHTKVDPHSLKVEKRLKSSLTVHGWLLSHPHDMAHPPAPTAISMWVHLRSSKIKKSFSAIDKCNHLMQISKFSHVLHGQYAKSFENNPFQYSSSMR